MLTRTFFALVHFAVVFNAIAENSGRVNIGKGTYHLGVSGSPEWQHFVGSTPSGNGLELRFRGTSNASEQTVFIRHKDVKAAWEIRLNNTRIGQLDGMQTHMVEAFAVPAHLLHDGENIFSIQPPRALDDIVVSDIRLEPKPVAETLSQATLEFAVVETGAGSLPCRITVADEQGALFQFYPYPGQSLAARVGVIYTPDGKARIGVPPGTYQVYAGRGFEYSVSTQKVVVAAGDVRKVNMEIRREVPTPRLIACDTHIHNRTFSGHGDATIDERMLTIAGEGIEVAVATDHNHHTSFQEPATKMHVREFFTPVVGNEVSTKVGHFNAYPIRDGATLPDHNLTNWPALVQNIRSSTGARVVQLNHPRDLHSNFVPFGEENFDRITGQSRRNPGFPFDAIEVVTSAAARSDATEVFQDWFALLNAGYRATGLGSSDTHDVAHYILGQARSYIVCDDTKPESVDIEKVCDSLLSGRVYVSQGLLTTMTVQNRFTVGDLATNLSETVGVIVTVLGPSWAQADTVQLFLNGVKIKEEKIHSTKKVQKAKISWSFPRPKQDAHLIALATGPGITAPFWALSRPYQPSSKILNPRLIGATNPVWLDVDGDRKFTPPGPVR